MAHWLVKSEPECYSWDDLVKEGEGTWDGVRNHAAAGHLRGMKKGDEAFFYHSRVGLEIVGVVTVSQAAFPDPTAESGNWVAVKVKPKKKLKMPVTLKAIKASGQFEQFPLVRQSRLSVMPVSDAEWKAILAMAG